MFSALSILASSAILFYVLRYRVHVHVTYTPTKLRAASELPRPEASKATRSDAAPTISRQVRRDSSARKRGTATEYPRQTATVPQSISGRRAEQDSSLGPTATATTRPVQIIEDIASGLVNLGAAKRPARLAAEKAVRDYPDANFDIQFSVALQEVRAA